MGTKTVGGPFSFKEHVGRQFNDQAICNWIEILLN